MNTKQGYSGIDRFRIVAALLVVAVHTWPLVSLGVLPDFIFTRVIARIGVPFFLAVSGFFLLAPYAESPKASPAPVGRFVRKTAIVYGLAILLYIPVNIYAGHWDGLRSVGDVLKMVLVDGTMYHLWYLPAAILGAVLVWLLLRYVGLKGATIIAAALYIIGLFGDSYFGFVGQVPWVNAAYQGIYTVSDFTRNGLFYAPIFLLVGAWAVRRQALPRKTAFIGFGAALVMMVAEGLVLFAAGTQRHDSMYILLPVCIFFLMVWLASFRGASSKALRDISLVVYVIHPWVIVLLRGVATPLGLDTLLVNNSVVHYLAVCIISFAIAIVLVWLKGRLLPGKKRQAAPKRAWMEIDMAALEHNTHLLQSLVPGGCRLMPAIKGNAYGFGAVPVAKALYRFGVRDFCVASLAEGIALRKQGVKGNILILGYTHPDDAPLIKRHHLAQTVVDAAHGVALAAKGIPLPVHIKVDTGMGRLGERSDHPDALIQLFTLKNLRVQGIFTQLSSCDSRRPEDVAYTRHQVANFKAVLEGLGQRGIPLPQTHIQCSYGILNYPELAADFARPGLAIYGIVDEACCFGPAPDLRPIFQVKAGVALIKEVRQGERVGYGSSCVAQRNMRIAVLTMGYADGLARSLSCGGGQVLLHGQRAPIVGNICMDQAMVDVSDIPAAAAGDIATIIGPSGGAEISVTAFAKAAGSIPNEIVSRLGTRLERAYIVNQLENTAHAAHKVRALPKAVYARYQKLA
ncbi:MAG: serine racemase VanT catalytic subunit [Ruminococcaceae bacterium]|nr:serine racemase VanT catalytic subunit [Oscillospiraceae bacterium]